MSAAVERFAYGPDPSQFGELTRATASPSAGGVHGVAVIIHGGFWRERYDLDLGRPLAASMAAAGWHAWNIEYRRVGNGGGSYTTLDDVANAIDHLVDIGIESRLPVVTIGHSAGGHLAVWAAGRQREPRWRGGVAVTAAISQAGVLDLRAGRASRLGDGGDAIDNFVGGPDVPIGADIDPAQMIPIDVPVCCVHGRDDVNVPIEQSIDYVRRARSAGEQAELIAVDGDHFTVIDVTSDAWRLTLAAVRRLGQG